MLARLFDWNDVSQPSEYTICQLNLEDKVRNR